MEEARPRLGRGLAALLGDVMEQDKASNPSTNISQIPIEFLRPNPKNPRRAFSQEDLEELANSIRERGILQPIIVRNLRHIVGSFEIIAGERRWRAAQLAGLHHVPILVIEADDRKALEIAIVENVQRSDLNALEEARGYEQLSAEFGYSQNELAKIIGKSRSHIANTLRLLKLPDGTRRYLEKGEISAGHARALLTLDDPDSVAVRIVNQGLSVRDVERISQKSSIDGAIQTKRGKDSDTRGLEEALTQALGLQVTIDHRGNKGELKIRYGNLEQLDNICQMLRR